LWKSLEELENTAEYQERVGAEFLEPPAKQEISSMERRDFLKVMGAGLAMASAACTRRPVEKVIPYVNKPEEITPGIANWYASTCTECSASCGVLVKTREGRPIKVEGNEEHPINHGALCARGQAATLNLYDPDRLRMPYMKTEAGAYAESTWSELDAALKEKLSAAQNVRVLTGSIASPSTKVLIRKFLASFKSGAHVSFDSTVPEELALSQKASYAGGALLPRYRFDQASTIVSFGADFLGTWVSPIEYTHDFTKGRDVEAGKMSRFTAFEATLSLTGSNADEYVQLKSGDELFIALAIAHEIIVAGGKVLMQVRVQLFLNSNNIQLKM